MPMRAIYIIPMLLTIAILVSPVLAFAGGPGFGGGVDDGGGACAVLLDGGLSLLFIAGISYGAKKIVKRKNIKPIKQLSAS